VDLKSRVAREPRLPRPAAGRGVLGLLRVAPPVTLPSCVLRLLRAGMGRADVDGEAPHAIAGADIADAIRRSAAAGIICAARLPRMCRLPQIDPGCAAAPFDPLINAASLGLTEPALYINRGRALDSIRSASRCWRLPVRIPRTRRGCDHTARPEYQGTTDAGARRADLALCPTGDSDPRWLIV